MIDHASKQVASVLEEERRLDFARSKSAVRRRRALTLIAAYTLLGLGGILMIGPYLWMVSTAFKPLGEVFLFPPTLLPQEFMGLRNFERVFELLPFGTYFYNTSKIAVLITVGQLFTSSLAGYAFARLRFPGRDYIFLAYIATMMIPFQVTLIPNYILMRYLGLINTHEALILPGIFTAFGTFLFRQFFLTIPHELEEAAEIDGASYFQRYWQIIVPLAKPAFATLGVITFMNSWNAFLGPLIYLHTQTKLTLTVGLAFFMDQYGTYWPEFMAGTTLSLIPIIVAFLFAQRYFIEGITLSGIKG